MILISVALIWWAMLGALVYGLSRRHMSDTAEGASWERSPSLFAAGRASFQEAMNEIMRSKPATAQDMRDRTQKDLYVRP
jgi:hypothetical protein